MIDDTGLAADLTIIPVSEDEDQRLRVWQTDPGVAGTHPARPFHHGTIVIAWDFSRAAARAVADSIPLLEKAKHVRIVTVMGEKPIDSKRSAEELAKNLFWHGLEVELDKVESRGRTVGETIETHAKSRDANMLVIGAYGHSRLREFILGGATRSLLERPPLPILFSH
jgi:nucleotide-binding universal stress UspA family protein